MELSVNNNNIFKEDVSRYVHKSLKILPETRMEDENETEIMENERKESIVCSVRGNQYYVFLEDLPRLQHIVLEACDYYQRLQSYERKHVNPETHGFPPAPEILEEMSITLTLEKCSNGLYKFSTEKIKKTTTTKAERRKLGDKKIDIPDVIETAATKEVADTLTIVSKNGNFQDDPYSKLDLSVDDKKELINMLEDEICQYVRETCKVLQDTERSKTGDNNLLITTGNAILNLQCGRTKRRPDIPNHKKEFEKLKRLAADNLVGFGSAGSGILVMVLEQNLTQTDKAKMKNMIQNTVSPITVEIQWLPKNPFISLIEPGDRLIPERKRGEYNRKGCGFGAIGVFGKTQNEELVCTTAGHVVQEKKDVFVEDFYRDNQVAATASDQKKPNDVEVLYTQGASNRSRIKNIESVESAISQTLPTTEESLCVKFGTCVANLSVEMDCRYDRDFAIVRIDKDVTKKVNPKSLKTILESPLSKISLFDDQASLTDETVYKVGPKTHLTSGIVKSDPFYFKDDDLFKEGRYILVVSKDRQKEFAEQGDSGSAVYRLKFDEEEKPFAEIVSTLIGEEGGKKDKETIFFTYRMVTALKEMKELKNLDVDINQNE